MPSPAIRVRNFSHVCVSVSEIERSLAFYRDLLGLETIFDVELAGPGLDAASGERGAAGRMVGCRVPGGGGVTIELLCFAGRGEAKRARPGGLGYSNVALSVDDLDAAWARSRRAACVAQRPVSGRVRMFFLTDPDGTPIEIIEFRPSPPELRGASHRALRPDRAVVSSRSCLRSSAASS
jgi:glyoxylase I family protein